jgi:hypothetical protein
MSKRTITLTDRSPISIEEKDWPVIAEANAKEHDGQVECQANRTSKWFLRVRQHADTRTIVYGGYDYDTCWQSERSLSARRGVFLNADQVASGFDYAAEIAAIREVAKQLADTEHDADDASRWLTLVAECIADFPAEEVE